jgi:hypothetical protein
VAHPFRDEREGVARALAKAEELASYKARDRLEVIAVVTVISVMLVAFVLACLTVAIDIASI